MRVPTVKSETAQQHCQRGYDSYRLLCTVQNILKCIDMHRHSLHILSCLLDSSQLCLQCGQPLFCELHLNQIVGCILQAALPLVRSLEGHSDAGYVKEITDRLTVSRSDKRPLLVFYLHPRLYRSHPDGATQAHHSPSPVTSHLSLPSEPLNRILLAYRHRTRHQKATMIVRPAAP